MAQGQRWRKVRDGARGFLVRSVTDSANVACERCKNREIEVGGATVVSGAGGLLDQDRRRVVVVY